MQLIVHYINGGIDFYKDLDAQNIKDEIFNSQSNNWDLTDEVELTNGTLVSFQLKSIIKLETIK